MGMFDYVRSEMALPDSFVGELQTKDFGCEMTEIVIRADGRLAVLEFEQQLVPWNERPYPLDKGFLHLAGCFRRVNERWRDLDFHGLMNFYGTETADGQNVWHEYEAKFTDGACVGIRQVGAAA